MDATEITFGAKDVAAIIVALTSILGFLYALKRNGDKATENAALIKKDLEDFKASTNEKFIHGKNSKKANIQYIMDAMQKNKDEVDRKESQIYTRISELKQEQQDAHEKLWVKLDTVENMQRAMSTSLAELTGYLKAKREI
jgi:alpha-D-ribose 1-methylphosphonate 5-triphosphate synthase subunit PhnG